jgi:MFS family permease
LAAILGPRGIRVNAVAPGILARTNYPMKTDTRVNIAQAIDDSKTGFFQIGIFVLCGICLIVDGFDVQVMGYVAPAIIQEWRLQNAVMAPVFSATLLGVLIGSFVFSMLADKIGRRPVMIGATLFFALMTLATAQADSVEELRWIRFVCRPAGRRTIDGAAMEFARLVFSRCRACHDFRAGDGGHALAGR